MSSIAETSITNAASITGLSRDSEAKRHPSALDAAANDDVAWDRFDSTLHRAMFLHRVQRTVERAHGGKEIWILNGDDPAEMREDIDWIRGYLVSHGYEVAAREPWRQVSSDEGYDPARPWTARVIFEKRATEPASDPVA